MQTNDANDWNRLAFDIEKTVNEACKEIGGLAPETIEVRPEPGNWSVKEIVGHLIDSASNNHQRFVRLQIVDGLAFPDYSQDNNTWVSIQRYQEAPWDELLALWRYFNLHLARVILTVDEEKIENVWVVNEDTTIALGEMMIDYLRHLKEHLQQIRTRIEAMTPMRPKG